MARYQLTKSYFGPTATSSTPSLHPQNSIIEQADDAPCSLYWLPLDAAAEAAIAREQQAQLQKRGGPFWSMIGDTPLPHGVGGTSERVGGPPPNWPPATTSAAATG